MLALTMGDPAGIGGELMFKAWSAFRDGPAFVTLDDADRSRALEASVPVEIVRSIPACRGRGSIADPSSLIAGIRMADRMGATS